MDAVHASEACVVLCGVTTGPQGLRAFLSRPAVTALVTWSGAVVTMAQAS